MFRIRFERKPEEVAAVRDACVVAGRTTVEVTKKAGVATGQVVVKGAVASRDWLHRITAPKA